MIHKVKESSSVGGELSLESMSEVRLTKPADDTQQQSGLAADDWHSWLYKSYSRRSDSYLYTPESTHALLEELLEQEKMWREAEGTLLQSLSTRRQIFSGQTFAQHNGGIKGD